MPTNAIELKLQFGLRKLFQGNKIGIHENLLSLQAHGHVPDEIVAAIEHDFGRKLSVASLIESPTIELLSLSVLKDCEVEYVQIEHAGPEQRCSPLIILGGSFDYIGFINQINCAFGRDVFVIPHQRYARIPQPPTVEGMAGLHLQAVRAIMQGKQFTLTAYCFHGLVAYEMTRLWISQGGKPPHLVLFDTTPTSGDFRQWIKMLFDVLGKRKRWNEIQKSESAYFLLHQSERIQRWLRFSPKACQRKIHFILQRLLQKMAALVKREKEPSTLLAAPPPHSFHSRPMSKAWRQTVFWGIAGYKMKPLNLPITLLLSAEWANQINIRSDRGWSNWTPAVTVERLNDEHRTLMGNKIVDILNTDCPDKFSCWEVRMADYAPNLESKIRISHNPRYCLCLGRNQHGCRDLPHPKNGF